MSDDETPVAEPVAEAAAEAAAEPIAEPAPEPSPIPAAEPVTESVAEATPAPAVEPVAESVPEPAPEPVAAQVAEPVEVAAQPVAAAFEPELAQPVTRSTDSVSSHSIRNIVVRVGAELGRATLPLAKAVGLTPGSVIELDRAADDPIDLYVNGRRFATGQLLLVDQTDWAIRIDHVLDVNAAPADFVDAGDDLI